jgi:putative N-acetylmannosamine-6-phosphate epimerase
MAVAIILGVNAKAYRNTATFGSPTWNEVDNVSNLQIAIATIKAKGRRRTSGMFAQYAITELDVTVSGMSVYDTADADVTAMQAAAVAGTEIDMIFLSGVNTSGAHQGPRISAAFTKWNRNDSEEEFLKIDWEACSGMTNITSWFTGTA